MNCTQKIKSNIGQKGTTRELMVTRPSSVRFSHSFCLACVRHDFLWTVCSACCLPLADFLFSLLLDSEDGGDMFFENICGLVLNYTVLQRQCIHHSHCFESFKSNKSKSPCKIMNISWYHLINPSVIKYFHY